MARGVKVHDPNDPKVGVVGGGAYAPAPHAPSPAAGHPYNPYCPVSWLPALGRSEHLLTFLLLCDTTSSENSRNSENFEICTLVSIVRHATIRMRGKG